MRDFRLFFNNTLSRVACYYFGASVLSFDHWQSTIFEVMYIYLVPLRKSRGMKAEICLPSLSFLSLYSLHGIRVGGLMFL